MKIRIMIATLLWPLCFLTGCDVLNTNEGKILFIQTDKETYHLQEDEAIDISIRNESGRTLYYSTCSPQFIEIMDNDEIVNTLSPPICYCLCPAELKPGETMPAEISGISMQHLLQFRFRNIQIDESSFYRIRFSFYLDKAFGDEPLSADYSRTNSFTLTGFDE